MWENAQKATVVLQAQRTNQCCGGGAEISASATSGATTTVYVYATGSHVVLLHTERLVPPSSK